MDEEEQMNRLEFEKIVEEVLLSLPEEFKKHLNNLLIVVSDTPSDEQRSVLHLRKHMRLYGLYQGVPLNFPGRDRMARIPDTITIFRNAILDSYLDIEDMKRQIRSTVLHEIGHYFGMTERQLRELNRKYLKQENIL